MKRRLVQWVIVAAWLVLMGWLVRYEAFPEWFAHTLPGYRGLLSSGPVIMDSWMKILFSGQPIGYSHTRVDTDDKNPGSRYRVENRTMLTLNIMGEAQKIYVSADAALDAMYNLQRFSFLMSSGRYTARVDGRRVGEQAFVARLTTPAGTQTLRTDVPDDAIIYSPFVEMSLSRLRPGQQMRIRTLDPVTMTTADVIVRAERRERITVMGEEKDTTLLAMNFQGMETRAWMDAEGQILRQETPFGWTMELSTPEEAMTLSAEAVGRGDDMLRAVAVPVQGAIADPGSARRLRLRFTGAPLPVEEMSSGRQQVESADEAETVVTVSAARWPAGGTRAAAPDEALDVYLKATPFVQSGHADIVARSRAIVGGKTDPLEQARAIYDWVHRKVEKTPTVSLPSAVDVLRVMRGDCNEHTYLFVALARAAGLPARIQIGLLYTRGAFYYHAWPAVFVGEWLEMDPTLGQETVDATHVALLEGELASQLRLLGMIGKLKAEVLEQEY